MSIMNLYSAESWSISTALSISTAQSTCRVKCVLSLCMCVCRISIKITYLLTYLLNLTLNSFTSGCVFPANQLAIRYWQTKPSTLKINTRNPKTEPTETNKTKLTLVFSYLLRHAAIKRIASILTKTQRPKSTRNRVSFTLLLHAVYFRRPQTRPSTFV